MSVLSLMDTQEVYNGTLILWPNGVVVCKGAVLEGPSQPDRTLQEDVLIPWHRVKRVYAP